MKTELKELMEKVDNLPPSEQVRLLIAIVMIAAVVMAWIYLLRDPFLTKLNGLNNLWKPRHPYFKDKYNGR
jgi:hypothetical protein